MGDYPATGNTTIFDDTGTYPAIVDVNGDLHVTAGTNASITKNEWQYGTELGKTFSVITPVITISGTAETDFLLLRNPLGATIKVEIHDLNYTFSKGSGLAIVKTYQDPTITNNGSALTPNKMNIGGAISPQALLSYNPTISNRGTVRRIFAQATGTLQILYDLGLYIPANHSLLITLTPSSNNLDHAIYIDWLEE